MKLTKLSRLVLLPALLLAAAARAAAPTPAESPAPAAARPGRAKPAPRRPPFYGELLTDDPAWAELPPSGRIDAIHRRLQDDPKSELAPRWRLTVGWLYETQLGQKEEAAAAYSLLSRDLGTYRYAAQAKLRASELDLQLAAAERDPERAAADKKRARRELDLIAGTLQRRGKQSIGLWELRGGAWEPVADPYGYVLERVDELTRHDPMYRLLDGLVRATGGIPGWSQVLALLFLAVGLKGLMYPLSRKTYQSMAAMQKLQPVVDDLRKRHKDEPAKLNEEMMRVYREHGVNPLGGCLPMLVQIPVFIFVYQGIRAYTFHFHQVGFLWIKSLAGPDTTLLLLYGVSMYFSQKLAAAEQPPPSDPQQAQMQKTMAWMMPVMFTWMMYSWGLPSAFYFYWLSFNVLSTVEQTVARRSQPAPPAAVPLSVLRETAPRQQAAQAAARRGAAGKKRRKRRGG